MVVVSVNLYMIYNSAVAVQGMNAYPPAELMVTTNSPPCVAMLYQPAPVALEYEGDPTLIVGDARISVLNGIQ